MGPFERASSGFDRNDDDYYSSDETQNFIISVLARVLHRLIDINHSNASISGSPAAKSPLFDSSSNPPISIIAYLQRIQKFAKCSDAVFIVALIYIDRLIELRNIVLTSLNVHRIIITSILLASKTTDDNSFNNSYFAKLGGLPPKEMNILECEFLLLVNYSLFVLPESYDKYYEELRNFIQPTSSIAFKYSEEETQPVDFNKTIGITVDYSIYQPSFQTYSNANPTLIAGPPPSQSFFTTDNPSTSIPHAAKPSSKISAPMSPSNLAYLASYYASTDNKSYFTYPSEETKNSSHLVSKYYFGAALECSLFR
jgi:hypothetical protein